MITETMPGDALNRNGIIIERARRAKQSLTADERNIILAGRKLLIDRMTRAGADWETIRHQINVIEMAGENDKDKVAEKIHVVVEFAYYEHPYEEFPARAQYLVRKSNHVALPEGSIVEAEQVEAAGQVLPKIPTYERWFAAGAKAVRS